MIVEVAIQIAVKPKLMIADVVKVELRLGRLRAEVNLLQLVQGGQDVAFHTECDLPTDSMPPARPAKRSEALKSSSEARREPDRFRLQNYFGCRQHR